MTIPQKRKKEKEKKRV